MSTATKILTNDTLSLGWWSRVCQRPYSLTSSLLAILALVTAFAIVYERSAYRLTLTEFQNLQMQEQELMLQTQQLQLESSVWANPARVQAIAEHQLAMHRPDNGDVSMVKL